MTRSRGLYMYQIVDDEVAGMPRSNANLYGDDHFDKNGTLHILNEMGGVIAMSLLPHVGYATRQRVNANVHIGPETIWKSTDVRTR